MQELANLIRKSAVHALLIQAAGLAIVTTVTWMVIDDLEGI